MERRGCKCWKVEAWIPMGPRGGIRRDLFHIIDMLAISPTDTIGVQITGESGFANHKRKLLSGEYTRDWLAGGRRLLLQAWKKKKIKRGGVAFSYVVREEEILLEHLPPALCDASASVTTAMLEDAEDRLGIPRGSVSAPRKPSTLRD